MAMTLTPGVAVQLLTQQNKGLLPDGFGARFCDEVHAKMWTRWPWRESLAELPPFYLVREEAYYGPPFQSVPTDFYALHEAWIRDANGGKTPLLVQKNLEPSRVSGTPTRLEYNKARRSFIVHPRPTHTTGTAWIEGTYKKTPTKITTSNMNSYVLPWDDMYFDVFRQGLRWKISQEIAKDKNWPAERAFFLSLLDDMAMAEGLADGTVAVAPENALELGSW